MPHKPKHRHLKDKKPAEKKDEGEEYLSIAVKKRKKNLPKPLWLSDELMLLLFSFLTPQEILGLACVSHRWYRISRDDYYWGKKIIELEWVPTNNESNFKCYVRHTRAATHCHICGRKCIGLSIFGSLVCERCIHGDNNLGITSRHRAKKEFLLDEIDVAPILILAVEIQFSNGIKHYVFKNEDLKKMSVRKFGSVDKFLEEKLAREGECDPHLPAEKTERRKRILEIEVYKRSNRFTITFVGGIPLLLPSEHILYNAYMHEKISATVFAKQFISKCEILKVSSLGKVPLSAVQQYNSKREEITKYGDVAFEPNARNQFLSIVYPFRSAIWSVSEREARKFGSDDDETDDDKNDDYDDDENDDDENDDDENDDDENDDDPNENEEEDKENEEEYDEEDNSSNEESEEDSDSSRRDQR